MIKKTVLITGGAGGIGLAVAKKFVTKKNYELILIDHPSTREKLHEAAYDLQLKHLSLIKTVYHDLTLGFKDTEKIIQENTENNEYHIDFLINIAGIAPKKMAPLVKTDLEEAKRIMDVNFWGTLNMCKAVLPIMQAGGFGRIVNVASISAFMADPGNLVYSASKAAVVQLTRALAKEATFNKADPAHPLDITVNAVAPGVVDTPMAKQLSEKMVEGFKATTPTGRLVTPEEVAKVIYWLAMEAPQSVTGAVHRIDGGYLT